MEPLLATMLTLVGLLLHSLHCSPAKLASLSQSGSQSGWTLHAGYPWHDTIHPPDAFVLSTSWAWQEEQITTGRCWATPGMGSPPPPPPTGSSSMKCWVAWSSLVTLSMAPWNTSLYLSTCPLNTSSLSFLPSQISARSVSSPALRSGLDMQNPMAS